MISIKLFLFALLFQSKQITCGVTLTESTLRNIFLEIPSAFEKVQFSVQNSFFTLFTEDNQESTCDIIILLINNGEAINKKTSDFLKKKSHEATTYLIVINSQVYEIDQLNNNQYTESLSQQLRLNFCVKENIFFCRITENTEVLRSRIKQSLIKLISKRQEKQVDYNCLLAEIALQRIAKKYNIKEPNLCLNKIMEGQLERALSHFSDADEAQKFLQEINQCQDYQYIRSPQNKFTQQRQILRQTKRQNVTNALKQICAKYKIAKTAECIQDLLAGYFFQAQFYVNNTNKENFKNCLYECEQLTSFLNDEAGFQQNNNLYKALMFIDRILEKYDIVEREECKKWIFENNFQEALGLSRHKIRQQFRKQLKDNNFLPAYWKSIEPRYLQDKLQKEVRKMLTGLLRNYRVTELDYCLEGLMNDKFEEVIEEIHPSMKQWFMKDLDKCNELKKYLSQKKSKKLNNRQIALNAVKQILVKYKCTDLVTSLDDALKGSYTDILCFIVRTKREQFLSQITNCAELQRFTENCELSKYSDEAIHQNRQSPDKRSFCQLRTKQIAKIGKKHEKIQMSQKIHIVDQNSLLIEKKKNILFQQNDPFRRNMFDKGQKQYWRRQILEAKQNIFIKISQVEQKLMNLISEEEQNIVNLFNLVFESYCMAMSKPSEIGRFKQSNQILKLPKCLWKRELNIEYAHFSKQIIKQITGVLGDVSKNYIEYDKNQTQSYLLGKHKKAEFKYFKFSKYFQEKQLQRKYGMSVKNLRACLKIDQLKDEIGPLEKLSKTIFNYNYIF